MPIGIYFYSHPAKFLERTSQISVFSAPSPFAEACVSLILHLGMFNFYGDPSLRYNLPGTPELFFPVGILFLIGMWIVVAGLVRSLKEKRFKNGFKVYCLLLAWVIIMLLPSVLTREEIPHSLRTIGVIPPVIMISSLGGVALYRQIKSKSHFLKPELVAIVAIFVIVCIFQCYYQYFIAWAQNPGVRDIFTAQLVDIGQAASKLHRAGYHTVVIVNVLGTPIPYPNGMPQGSKSVEFTETADCYKFAPPADKLNCQPYSTYILLNQIDQIDIRQKTAIIPMADLDIIFTWLKEFYPQGQVKLKDGVRYYEIPPQRPSK